METMESAGTSRHEMAVLGREGDTKVIWDPGEEDEVENARKTFERLTGKGYSAFAVKKNGDPGKRIKEFDPEEGKLILVPQMVGG